jgi:hypothetical protein
MNVTERNIEKVLNKASKTTSYQEGLTWYSDAATQAECLPVSFSQACGIIAALSPQVSWDRNVGLAQCLTWTGTAPCLSKSVDKAKELRDTNKHPLAVLGGKKVRAFYKGIVTRGKTFAVCLDRHAFAIAAGKNLTEKELAQCFSKVGVYEQIEQAYRNVAFKYKLWPAQVQAITWVQWRKDKVSK